MNYELLYIIPANYSDQEIDGVISKITQTIEKAGVKITRNENLGKLKLAYPIKHARHGFYVLVNFEAESTAVAGLDRELRLLPEIIRFQALKLEAKAPAKEIKMVSYEAPRTEEPRRREPAPAPKKKVDLKELDKKLDEILEKDIEI